MKVSSRVIIVTLALALTFGVGASAENKLRVGVTLPLTGSLSHFGASVKNAILLAQSDLKSAGKVEFIFEDDAYQAKNTIAAVSKLLDQDKVDALLVFGSPPSLAAAPIAEQRRKPMIAIATAPDLVKNRSFVFRHLATFKTETDLVESEVKRRGYKDVAIVSTINDAMIALRDEFVSRGAVKVIANEEVPPGDLELKSLATKMTSLKATAIYLLVMPPQAGVLAKQLREVGYQGDIFSAHQLEDPREIVSAGGALEGAWIVSTNAVKGDEFPKGFEKMFHEKPGTLAANGYDIAKIFILGAGESDLAQYIRSLKNFEGVMGSYGVNSQNEFELPAVLRKVTANGFVLQ